MSEIFYDLAKELVKYAAKKAGKRLERNRKILKILKDTPFFELKDDFDSVYAHTLVEFSVDGKSPHVIKFFADDAVRDLFKKELYSDKPDKFGTTPEILATIQRLGKDKLSLTESEYRTLLDEFIAKFGEMTNRARKPSELEMFNEIKYLKLRDYKRSFDYQIDVYLQKLRDEFHKDFLDKNHYIDLNGEIRKEKRGFEKFGKRELTEEQEAEDDRYEKIKYEPLDDFLNQWLRDDSQNFLVILGEYGTGKTTFFRHLAHQMALNRLGDDVETKITDSKSRVPLFLPLRNFEKSMESFIADQLNNKDGITDINYARFLKRIDSDEFVLLLDGFDEMTQKIDADEKARNFDRIQRLIECSKTSKIILTCREEYFKTESEIKTVFTASRKAQYEFIHLLPFNDGQIKQFLQSHTADPKFYWEQIKNVFDLHDLAKRPVLLEFIVKYLPDIIKEKGRDETINASDLYAKCIDDELRRKSCDLEFILPNKYRLNVLQDMAVWMFLNDVLSYDVILNERDLKLKQYFEVKSDWEFEKYLNEFLTFTFLIRESDNQFRLSHKSFRDYLTAQALVNEINTDQFTYFGSHKLSDEIIHFVLEQKPDKATLLKLVKTAKDLGEENQWQGSNAANMLLKMDRKVFVGQDLSGCQLQDIDFSGCSLQKTNLRNANLSQCEFYGTLFKANYEQADFTGASLGFRSKNLKVIPDLHDLENLGRLILSSNQISDVSALGALKNLTRLDLDSNQISDVSALGALKNLTYLRLNSNQISEVSALGDLKNLILLWLDSNQISDVSSLGDLKNLTDLRLGFNQLSDVSSLGDLKNLTALFLYSNQIRDVSALKDLKNLNKLWLDSNQISDVSALGYLKNLTSLYLHFNQINDVSALGDLKNLTHLELQSNQISDVPALGDLKNLRYLDLENNPIPVEQKEALKEALPNTNIRF